MIHLLELCCLRTSNGLSLGVWWVSNILTHISHFPSWIVVISSSFMCFDEFCECIGDLRTNTEIETKKPEKMDKSWRRSKQNQGEISRAGRSPIMGRTTAQNSQKEGKTRGIAGRSPKSSRTIARVTNRKKNSLGRTFTNFGRTFAKLGGRSPNLDECSPGQFSASNFYEPNVGETQPNDRQTSLMQKRWRFNFVSRGEIRLNHLGYKYIMFWTKRERNTERNTTKSSRTPREDWLFKVEMKMKLLANLTWVFSILFIFFSCISCSHYEP